MSQIPRKYHTNIKFYTQYTHPTLICRGTDTGTDGWMDGRMDGRTDGWTENIYSIFRDKLVLLGEHVLWVAEGSPRNLWMDMTSSLPCRSGDYREATFSTNWMEITVDQLHV